MDVGVVVAAQTVLLLAGPAADGLLEVGLGVLAADHEADLAGGVGGDGGVGVLSNGEDLVASLLQVGDELEVKPLVLGCKEKCTARKPCPSSGFGYGIVQESQPTVLSYRGKPDVSISQSIYERGGARWGLHA